MTAFPFDDVYLGPWHDRDPDEPPELEEEDYARSQFDARTGEFFDV